MALHALENVGTAVDLSREFLFPFDLRRWLKLALVVFFLGGASVPSSPGNAGGPSDGPPGQVPEPGGPGGIPDDLVLLLAALVAALLVIGLIFAVVGAIMEFVFVESLRSGDVTLRRYWGRRWRQGLRLFGFRLAIGLPFFLLIVGWLAVLFVPLLLDREPILPVAFFVLGIPVIFVVGLVYAVVSTFTTAFVVPIMILEDSGVLAAWGRLWSSVRAEWKQYLAFALVWVGLVIATGIVASIAFFLALFVLLVPLGIAAAVVYVTVSFSTVGLVLLGVLGAILLVALIVAGALIQVPILTYLRYYALLVLGDVEPELDLVADRRPAGE